MANTLKLGAGKWATGTDTVLAFNDENNNFKPLPFDFSRASSATVVNQSGLIETVGSGEPRIDFQGNTKGALLLEPQRSNDILYSQDFSNAAWAKGGTSVTSGFVSPDGTLNADKITPTGINEAHQIYQNKTITSNQSYTISAFMKFGGYRYLECRETFGGKGIGFDTTTQTFYGINTPTSFKGVILKNGWVKMEATYTSIGTSAFFLLYATPILMNPTFLGDGTSHFYTYGAQLEQGSYATSIIPTSGSAVTRVQDVSKIVNSPILQATNQFTLFFDAKDFLNYGATFANIMFTLGAGESPYDASTGIHIYNKIWYYFNGSSAVTLGNCYNATTDSKFAISYDGTKYTKYANGVKLGTNTVSASMSNWDTITNGSLSYSGVDRVFNLADLKLYNTALTDAELQALTTI